MPIHAFAPDGTPSRGAQTALNNATEGLATETYVDGAVDAIPEATTSTAGLMSPADQVRLAAPGIYAADYGATGDGITDDSAALAAACAAAEGRVLHLTAGAVYSIRSKVVLSDGITVEGHGATLAKPTDSTDNLALVKGSNGKGYGAGGTNITIRDLAIAGNYAASSGYGDATSSFHHVTDLTFDRCRFTQGMLNGHYLDLAGCDNVRVVNSDFAGANPREGREYIEAVQLDYSYYAGLSDKSESLDTLDGLPTRDVTVSQCTFSPLTVAGTDYPMPIPIGNHSAVNAPGGGRIRNISFTNNTVAGWVRDTTSSYSGWVHLIGVRAATISHNTFTHTGPPQEMSRGVIAIRRAAAAVSFGQIVEPSPTKEDVDWHCADVLIDGNTFAGFEEYFQQTEGNALIELFNGWNPQGIRIVGNHIGDCNGEGIRIHGSNLSPVIVSSNNTLAPIVSRETAIVATGNVIGGPTRENAPGAGLLVHGSINPVVQIVGNTVTGYASGIEVRCSDNGVVQGNNIQNYTAVGIQIGQAAGGNAYNLTVSSNRVWSKIRDAGTKALWYAPTANRAMTFGNRCRDGGSIVNDGTQTISASGDQTS